MASEWIFEDRNKKSDQRSSRTGPLEPTQWSATSAKLVTLLFVDCVEKAHRVHVLHIVSGCSNLGQSEGV